MNSEKEKEAYKIYNLLMNIGFFFILVDVLLYCGITNFDTKFSSQIHSALSKIYIFNTPLHIKMSSIFLLALAGLGASSRKRVDFDIKLMIIVPIILGLILVYISLFIQPLITNVMMVSKTLETMQILYIAGTLASGLLIYYGVASITRYIRVSLGKDIWNIEGESFLQETKKIENENYINIPTKFYYHNKYNDGWINLNPFRGTLLIGVPGSGKSFSIVFPFLRQMVEKDFSLCVYDIKYPDLSEITYLSHLKHKSKNNFKVLHIGDLETTVRVNPISIKYMQTLSDANETAECLVEAMNKSGDNSSGGEKFFQDSAKNLLAATIFFLMKYKDGKYCDLPHVLSIINLDYEHLFPLLYSNEESRDLIQGVYSAWKSKAFDQLEGQVGSLRVVVGRLSTKETFYVFRSCDEELDLFLSKKENPTTLILGSNPQIKNIASTLYASVLNRITKLVNSKGNVPFGLIVDEAPTLYVYDIDGLLATARSNKVAVLVGMQEIPQLKKQYGKMTADTVNTVFSNVICAKVTNTDTINWIQKNTGKKKQISESVAINKRDSSITVSERMEYVISEGRLSQLATGEVVGWVAKDAEDGKKKRNRRKEAPPIFNCKINIDERLTAAENKNFKKIPKERTFKNGNVDELLMDNMREVRENVQNIIADVIK